MKILLWSHRCRWEDIKADHKEVGCVCVDWIHLAQDRIQLLYAVNTVPNLRVP